MLLVFSVQMLNAQWVQTNGPGGGPINVITASGDKIYAGTKSGGVFLSTNSGESWIGINSNLPNLLNLNITALGANGNTVCASTYANHGFFISRSNGTTWQQADTGVPLNATAFAFTGSTILAGTWGIPLFLSTNNGTDWSEIRFGPVYAFAISGNTIFAGTEAGISLSTDNGLNWIPADSGLMYGDVRCLAVSGNNIFAAAGGRVFRSTNNGTSWFKTDSGLANESHVKALAANSNAVFAGTSESGVFVSTNNGTIWTKANSGLTNIYIHSLANCGNAVFAGTNEGVFRSTDNGATWTESNFGLSNTNVASLAIKSNILFAGIGFSDNYQTRGIFLSTDKGTNWSSPGLGLPPYLLQVRSFSVSGNNIFASVDDKGVFLSTDNGINWKSVNSGLTDSAWVNSFATYGNTIFVGTVSGIFYSSDNGASWNKTDSGNAIGVIRCFAINGNSIFAGGSYGIFISSDSGKSWKSVDSVKRLFSVNAITIHHNIVFSAHERGISFSTDNGTNWDSASFAYDSLYNNVCSFAANGRAFFAGSNNGVLLSLDTGRNWIQVNSGLTNMNILSLALSGNELFAATNGSGVWRRPISELVEIMDNKPLYKFDNSIPISVFASVNTHSDLIVKFSLIHSAHVAVNIFDLSGKQMTSLVNQYLGPGSHSFRWDSRSFASGCYVMRIRMGENAFLKNIPVFK